MAHQLISANISGAEFGGTAGIHDQQYHYPTYDELLYYKNKGILWFRLPFIWDRMQNVLNGPLNTAELALMTRVLNDAQTLGMTLFIDNHSYARHGGNAIGSTGGPTAANLADFWRKMASAVKNHPALEGYDVMNEPNNMPSATAWKVAAQAAINAIREVDTTHTIYIEGDNWSGAHSWDPTFIVNDPANNLVYQAHQYLDRDSSGSYKYSYDGEGAYPMVGVDKLKKFVDWIKANNFRGMIGEFGVPSNDARWLDAEKNMLDYMVANTIGGTAWSVGAWWPADYELYLSKPGTADSSAFGLLKNYFTAVPGTPVVIAPTPVESRLTVRRVGSDTLNEGQNQGLTFEVANGKVDQSFTITYQNTVNAADFTKSVADMFAAKTGIVYVPANENSGTVRITQAGNFTFTVERPIKLDNVAETNDQSSWVAGNQEQSDIIIGNLTGGLVTSTTTISNWITDMAGEPLPPAPPPVAPTTNTVPTAKAQTYISVVAGTKDVTIEGADWNGQPIVRRFYEARSNGVTLASGDTPRLTIPAEHLGKPIKGRVTAFDAEGDSGWVDSWNSVTLAADTAPPPPVTPPPPTTDPRDARIKELEALVATRDAQVKGLTDKITAAKAALT
jgi:hypothetical protein